jgi:hypothetical protein
MGVHMFRRSIFWGLTLMLGTLLVWLVVRARKQEAQIAMVPAPTEIVRSAKSSPTRVIAPKDLDAGESQVEFASMVSGAPKSGGRSALLHVVIRNRGAVPYRNVMLKLTWVGTSGKAIDSQTHLVPGTIEPGQTLNDGEVALEGVPSGSVKCTIAILHSDLGQAQAR